MGNELFETVKRKFFPRWDLGNEWILEELDDLDGADGYACRQEKSIKIRSKAESGVWLEVLLIHEVCHAVTTGNHGKAWLKRMGRAVRSAERLNRQHLAVALRSEIETYTTRSWKCTPSIFYQTIRDLTLLNFPTHGEHTILRAAGRAIGLSYEEVLRNFPCSLRIFHTAQQEAEDVFEAGDPFRIEGRVAYELSNEMGTGSAKKRVPRDSCSSMLPNNGATREGWGKESIAV